MSLHDDIEQMLWNLTNHRPAEGQVEMIEETREQAKALGAVIISNCEPTRERSLALTSLEQTVMWAVASIARERPQVGQDAD